MGLFDILKGKRGEKFEANLELPKTSSSPQIEPVSTSFSETKTVEEDKLKVLEAKIESLKVTQEIMSEKIDRIEKMVKEIYDIAKSQS